MSARDELIDFVVQYGGRCRDCADEVGFCPQTGIGCGQRRKAVEFVLGAIEYGIKHGFVSGYTIIRDDENHKATVERRVSLVEREASELRGVFMCGRADSVQEDASALRSLIKEDGA